jgi:hypothetical protein
MNAITQAESYITEGQSLFQGAEQAASDAGGSSFTGVMAATGALLQALPSGAVRSAVQDILQVAGGAAAGATAGSIVPGIGTAIGAAVGAVVSVFEELFSSDPPTPQGEYRWSAQAMCFPALADSTKWTMTVLPGVANLNPRGRLGSIFYQIANEADPNLTPDTDWCQLFGFRVGWIKGRSSTPLSVQAGWYLAYLFTSKHSPSLESLSGQALQQKMANIAIAQNQLANLLGPTVAARAMRKLEDWYGRSFSAEVPFGRFNSGYNRPTNYAPGGLYTKGAIADYAALCSAWGGGGHNDGVPMGACGSVEAIFRSLPLDYTYYPVFTRWDGSEHVASDPIHATAVFLTPDTLLLGLAELAAQDAHDVVALHYVMALAHLWKVHQFNDVQKALSTGADPSFKNTVAPHPNFMRVLGRISRLIQNARKAGVHGDCNLHGPGFAGTLPPSTHGAFMTPEHHAWIVRALRTIRKSQGRPTFGAGIEQVGDTGGDQSGASNATEQGSEGTLENANVASSTAANVSETGGLGSGSTEQAQGAAYTDVWSAAKGEAGQAAATALGIATTSVTGNPILGTLLEKGGTAAVNAFTAATAAPATETVTQSVPSDPEAQTSNAMGIAAAHGEALQKIGQVPPPDPALPPAQKAAQTIVHGLTGAPDPVKKAVLNQLGPSSAQGIEAGVASFGGQGSVAMMLLTGAAVGGWLLYEHSKKAGMR